MIRDNFWIGIISFTVLLIGFVWGFNEGYSKGNIDATHTMINFYQGTQIK